MMTREQVKDWVDLFDKEEAAGISSGGVMNGKAYHTREIYDTALALFDLVSSFDGGISESDIPRLLDEIQTLTSEVERLRALEPLIPDADRVAATHHKMCDTMLRQREEIALLSHRNALLRDVARHAEGFHKATQSWNKAVEAIIGTQPRTGIPIEELESALKSARGAGALEDVK